MGQRHARLEVERTVPRERRLERVVGVAVLDEILRGRRCSSTTQARRAAVARAELADGTSRRSA